MATSSWAGGPRSHLPHGARQIATWLDVEGLQVFVAVDGEVACTVFAFDFPPGPPEAAALGALRPLPQNPAWHAKRMDRLQRQWRGLLFLGFAKGHIFGDEKGIFDFRRVGVPRCGQQLDGDDFLQLPEALDPLQRGGGATVLQYSTHHWNVLLHCGYGEVSIEDVAAALSLYSQVVPIMLDSFMTPLFDVNVGSTNGNCNNVTVSITGGENNEKDLNSLHICGDAQGDGGGLTLPCCTSQWSFYSWFRSLHTVHTCPLSCWNQSPCHSLPSHTDPGHTPMWCRGHRLCRQSPAGTQLVVADGTSSYTVQIIF